DVARNDSPDSSRSTGVSTGARPLRNANPGELWSMGKTSAPGRLFLRCRVTDDRRGDDDSPSRVSSARDKVVTVEVGTTADTGRLLRATFGDAERGHRVRSSFQGGRSDCRS